MGECMRGTREEGGLCVPMLSGEFKCACGWAVVVTEVEQSLVIYVMCVRVCGRCLSPSLSLHLFPLLWPAVGNCGTYA